MRKAGCFETERLRAENWSELLTDDKRRRKLTEELTLILTVDVLRHLPEPLRLTDSPQAVADWIARNGEADVLCVRHRKSASLLGLLILADVSEPAGARVIHLGYLFAEPAWGKGYATELLARLVRWHRKQGRAVRLLGGVAQGNPASARVLLKAGFNRAPELSADGTEMFSRDL